MGRSCFCRCAWTMPRSTAAWPHWMRAPRRGPRSGWPTTRRPGRVRRRWWNTGWRTRHCRPSTPGVHGHWVKSPTWTRCCAPAMAWTWRCWHRTACPHRAGCSSCRTPSPAMLPSRPQPHGAMPAKPLRGPGWARSIRNPTMPRCWRRPVPACQRCTRSCRRRSPTRCWCGATRRRAGGLDVDSYAGWNAALVDLSLRMAGLGWRNVLCETAFVSRAGRRSAVMAISRPWPRAGRAGCLGWLTS